MKKTYHVLIEKDEDGMFVGKVPELKGCHTQGENLNELMDNIKEAIALCLEVQQLDKKQTSDDVIKFIGVQEIEV